MATLNPTVDNIIVSGSDAADSIKNSGSNVTIVSYAGNDTISNSGATVMIDGGADDDLFFVNAKSQSPTITTGDGKDTISFTLPNLSEQTPVGVIITDLSSEDVLSFNKNIASVTAEYSMGGLILTDDKNNFSVTLSGTTSTKDIVGVKIYTQEGSTSTSNSLGNILTNPVYPKTSQQVMKDFVSSLDKSTVTGTAAIDAAIVYASDGRFTGYQDLVTAFVNDYINATDKTNFFKNYCGIDLTNTDVGAITGYDAGGATSQISAVDIVPENKNELVKLDEIYRANSNSLSTAVSDATITSGTLSFTKNGLTVKVAEFDNLVSQSQSTDETATSAKNKLTIINGLYSWWIKNSLDLINNSFGVSFTTEGATATELNLGSWEDTLDSAAYVSLSGSDLKINTAKVKDLNLTDSPSGFLTTNYYLDRLIAHELTRAVLSANVTDLKSYTNEVSNNNYRYWAVIVEGLGELTQGADDTRKDALNKLVEDFVKEGISADDIISTVVGNAATPAGDKSALQAMLSDVGNVEYVFGYALLRYFAEQVKESSDILPGGVRYADNKNTVVVNSLYNGNSFNLAGYSNTAKNLNVSSVKQEAYAILGNDANNVITALPAGGSIYGGAGADTLYASDGVDYFFYADGGGGDIIYNFATNDFLKIIQGTIDNISADQQNNDVTVKLAHGTIILKDVAGKEISIIDAEGNTIKKAYTVETPQDTTSGGTDTTSGGTDTTSGGTDTTSGGTDTVASDNTLKCIDGYYEYTGDHKVIADYIPGERIRYSTDFTGYALGDGDISLQSSTGELTLKNSSSKVMEVVVGNTNNLIYLYRQAGAGNVDGSEFSAFEVIMGATNNANYIAAGSGGSSLWGGGGTGENTLVGGAGDDKFIYTGGNDVIQNAETGDEVKIYSGNWSGVISGDNLILSTDAGSISLQNIRDQLVKLVQGNGDLTLNAYYAEGGDTVDLRGVAGYQYIVGSNNASDNIYIGGAGGSLWGGSGDASDTLAGNSGDDVFFWGKGDGTDIITNSNSSDSVRLYDVSLADISQTAEIGDNILSIGLKSGTNLFVQSNEDISPTFYLTDSTWKYNTSTDWVRLN